VPFQCPSLPDQDGGAIRPRVLKAASSLKKLISDETIGKVVWEQGPFSKLCIILVGN
jgi:hypothetical protein